MLKKKIPEDWRGSPKISESLIANKFLAFKCPLHEGLNAKLPVSERFNLQDVFDYIENLKALSYLIHNNCQITFSNFPNLEN